jgi:hypothetical protein
LRARDDVVRLGGAALRGSEPAAHSLGSCARKGLSLDLYLTGSSNVKDGRGFWRPSTALSFLFWIRRLVRSEHVLYNDFVLAQAVNAATGSRLSSSSDT